MLFKPLCLGYFLLLQTVKLTPKPSCHKKPFELYSTVVFPLAEGCPFSSSSNSSVTLFPFLVIFIFSFTSFNQFSNFQVRFNFPILKTKSENHFRGFLSSFASCSEASGFLDCLHSEPFLQGFAVA